MPEIHTADGVAVDVGARVFNYYDMRAGFIAHIDPHAQPDTMKGQTSSTPIEEWSNHWFDHVDDEGGHTHLDGSRICSMDMARRKGWVK